MKKTIIKKKLKVLPYAILGVFIIIAIIIAFLILNQKGDKELIQRLDEIAQTKGYENRNIYNEGVQLIEKIEDKKSAIREITNFYKAWANYTYNFGQVDSSIIIIEKALKENPQDIVLITKYGFYLFHTGKGDMAVANWKKALEIDPTYTQTYVNLITYYMRDKFIIDSLNYYVNALQKLDPNYPISQAVFDTLKHFKKNN